MTREASHITGNSAAAMISTPPSSALPSACAAQALAAATTATIKNSNSASLDLRLTARSCAARGAQVETFHSAVQGLARQPKALCRTADIAARFSKAGLQHLTAEVFRFARRRSLLCRQIQIGRDHHTVASQQLGALD